MHICNACTNIQQYTLHIDTDVEYNNFVLYSTSLYRFFHGIKTHLEKSFNKKLPTKTKKVKSNCGQSMPRMF